MASESVDGEILVARTVGRLRLLAAGRAFAEAYGAEERRYAVHGGPVLNLTASVNVGTVSLEGASRGRRTRLGFEHTVPINVRRYLPLGSDDRPDRDGADEMQPTEGRMAMAGLESSPARADTVVIEIHNLAYVQEEITVSPGTTVVWMNGDPVQHSVVADDVASFDSGLIDPEGRFSMTFDEVGDSHTTVSRIPSWRAESSCRSRWARMPMRELEAVTDAMEFDTRALDADEGRIG